jgi:hypothetical protein
MSAVNLYPWVYNLNGATKPLIFRGKVQAGSTQAIKRGEICTYDETSGYFIPADAVADYRYSLAIANEEQKSDGLARYMEFIALREDDVFEFELDASVQIALGDALTLTASNSQKLTRDLDGYGVAFSVGDSNYPEVGTTLRYDTYARVCFNPTFSYWCQRVKNRNIKKYIDFTTSVTPKIEDCGAVFTSTGGGTITAPNGIVPVGWFIDVVCVAAAAVIFDPKPDTSSIIIKGGVQSAGKYSSITDEGDFMRVLWNGTYWVAVMSISGADGDISVEG